MTFSRFRRYGRAALTAVAAITITVAGLATIAAPGYAATSDAGDIAPTKVTTGMYQPDTGPRVRVNQVGYLPVGPKDATVVTDATLPLDWRLKNAAGAVVASGATVPRGLDASSGQRVHSIDFRGYNVPGTGYTLVADGQTSRSFDIGADQYEQLRLDALKFYYPQRSGIAIDDKLRPGYGRDAGHVGAQAKTGDVNAPCQPGACDYTLDVQGGWYDAGDMGKYVVNGGIASAQLMSQFERTKTAQTAKAGSLADGTLAIPESGNGVPDILDEARWEMEFLLRMQVPAGKPLAGMAHHKVHDDSLDQAAHAPVGGPDEAGAAPAVHGRDAQSRRHGGAGGAVFAQYDPAFASQCLAAAKMAWVAAVAHPAIYATDADSDRWRRLQRLGRLGRVLLGWPRSSTSPPVRSRSPTSSSPRRTTRTQPGASAASTGARSRCSAGSTWPPCRMGCPAVTRSATRSCRAPTGTWPRSMPTRTACRTLLPTTSTTGAPTVWCSTTWS